MWKLFKGLFITLALVGVYKLCQGGHFFSNIEQSYHQLINGPIANKVTEWIQQYPIFEKLEQLTNQLPTITDFKNLIPDLKAKQSFI